MTKVIQLYDEDNGTENTLMIFTCQRYYHNQIIIQKSEFENTYQFQMIVAKCALQISKCSADFR